MRILHLSLSSKLIGGAERYVGHAAEALTRTGHAVTVVYVRGPRETRLSALGIHEYRLPEGPRSLAEHKETLRSIMRAEQPEVAIAHTMVSPEIVEHFRSHIPTTEFVHNHRSYCASGEKLLRNSKSICTFNSEVFTCLFNHVFERCGTLRPTRAVSEARHTQHAMRVERTLAGLLTASEYVKRQLIRHGIPSTRITVAPLPAPRLIVPDDHEGSGDGTSRRVLFAGRLTRGKGLDVLIAALSRLGPAVQLDVAGDGWFRRTAEQQAKALGLGERVRFHGWVEGETLARLYQRSAVVVVPSVWPEPFGLVALEAMANGKPVVATSAGGLPEVVAEGVTGFLVPPFDDLALADRVERLLADRQLASRMGEAGRQHVSAHYRTDTHVQCLIGALQRAIVAAGHGAR